MKTQVKKLDATKRELQIEIEGDLIGAKFEDIFKKIAQEAKVPGFRPGHAPRDVLEKHYASQAHEQALKELVPDIYNQAIEKEGLDVVDLPEIYDVKLDRKSLSFKAAVEITPEIKLGDYKGLKVEHQDIEIAADEIKRRIDSLKESRQAAQLDDRFARGLGYVSLAELEKVVSQQAFLEKESEQRHKIEASLIERLHKTYDFKLPESLVKRQQADMLRRAKLDLALNGLPREKIDENEETLSKNLEPEARSQVKTYLILAAIARKENIPVNDEMPGKVVELLLREADW